MKTCSCNQVAARRWISRRELLQRACGGFGALALRGVLADMAAAESFGPVGVDDPLAPRPAHFSPRAKQVIFLYMSGGASHVDTFDPKPKLLADHGKTIAVANFQGKGNEPKLFLKAPQWAFKPGGSCGTQVSELFPHVRSVVDNICVIRSMESDHLNHYEGTLGIHSGSFTVPRPSVGAWVSYGLGTENRNLPSFMVLAPATPYAGSQVWGSDFLPGCHQATHVNPGSNPIPNLVRRVPSHELQQLELDLVNDLNRRHLEQRDQDSALEARIRSFETAFGMQREATEAFDLSAESEATLKLYGLEHRNTYGFGWQCLVARRLVEHGVRFVELIDTGSSDNWDSHGNMLDHAGLAKKVDQPIAGLITDLKQRGMLDETLVIWTTEFGRTPCNKGQNEAGRDHHFQAFSSWMAGGGVKGGIVYGSTDEYGIAVTEQRMHVHDFHATILHMLGLDHERLTFRHAGRDFRLTDVHGKVAHDILA